MAEVELDPRLEAPFERHLVDGDRALAAIHGRGEMPGCVEVGGIVGRERDPLDRPAFAIRQILLTQAGKELDDVGRGLAVGGIVDLRPVSRRVGGDVVFQRHGNVDQCARHVSTPGAAISAVIFHLRVRLRRAEDKRRR
jgi:hypothetical protein